MARSRNLRPTEGARFLLERKVDPTPIRTSDPSIDVPADDAAVPSPEASASSESASSAEASSTSHDVASRDGTSESSATGDAPATPTRALYRAAIYTPEGEYATDAVLAEDGTVSLAGATGAPGDLDDRLKNIAKLVARDAPKRRDDGLVVWPARIMRWRK